jgi:basic membrane protein A
MKAGADVETGVFVLGLAEDGVGYALDEYNASLVSDEMKAAVDAARQQIIDGKIEVVSYYANDSCPVLNF